MVKELNKKYRECRKSRDEASCDALINELIRYTLKNRWGFIFDTVSLPFDTENEMMIIIKSMDMQNGYLKPCGLIISTDTFSVKNESGISFKDKIDFIGRTIPLIPQNIK